MFFSLDVLPARKGDCLMLHYGTEDKPRLMLIDGGPADVYTPHLKPRLEMIRTARTLDDGKPLPVEVVMVTHIDDDHINGILELTEEQRQNAPGLRLKVSSLWFNSLDDLLSTDEVVAGRNATSSVLAGMDDDALGDIDIENEDQHQTVEVLSSIPQGRTLRDDAEFLNWNPNHKFGGKLIMAVGAAGPVDLGPLQVTVVGPMQPELLALQKAHDKWLKDHEEGKETTPEAMLAAFVDKSVPNLSSIVVLVEAEGKKMLLTGDARGDKILKGLELVGVIKNGGELHVDILKVPHHGSSNNMATTFFARVTADHYVFSGNGEHGNPERETLEMLLEARDEDEDFTIHLTYPIDEIDEARKADWKKEQAKEQKRKERGSDKPVRPNWSPAKNGLVAFFKAHPKFEGKVVVVEDETPHLIHLGDEFELE
ncbi:hypothetical protein [Tardiphaga sp. OK245]|uniref:hypothetical protein n=1 Tax=Tardiphaga sp. OK245 TaxID=1855306 RepID=UPI0008A7E00F|nr:hypothetical protein [Tardiphaga sp. OK245]SEI09347.1 hypothetical protein SAMN05216367_3720 [Tardiphaga sp. OK245]